MGNKIPSEIVRIELSDASYKDTNTFFAPTYVNFFFGNNGTGKSTIAKAIQSGFGVTYAPGRKAEDYLALVFNQEFIDAKNYRNMRGVFTINEINAEIQSQIDAKTEERNKEQKLLREASELKEKKETARDKIQKDFYKSCWNREAGFRAEFSKTQGGKGKSKQFTEEILKHQPKDIDIEELRRLYDSAFSDTARRYARFHVVEDVEVLDSIEGEDILSVVIVNSSNTELAAFLREIGATQWMQQGYSDYSVKAEGKCPYCGRKLDDNFDQIVTESFDNRYQNNLRRLESFLDDYRQKANDIFMALRKIPEEVYPQIDPKPYLEKLEVLRATIQSNIDRIKSKKEQPALEVSLEKTSSIMEELKKMIEGV